MTNIVIFVLFLIGSLAGTALTVFIAATVVKAVFGDC